MDIWAILRIQCGLFVRQTDCWCDRLPRPPIEIRERHHAVIMWSSRGHRVVTWGRTLNSWTHHHYPDRTAVLGSWIMHATRTGQDQRIFRQTILGWVPLIYDCQSAGPSPSNAGLTYLDLDLVQVGRRLEKFKRFVSHTWMVAPNMNTSMHYK